jgi:hypothetical protein
MHWQWAGKVLEEIALRVQKEDEQKKEIRFRNGDNLIISILFFEAFVSSFFLCCFFYSFEHLPFIWFVFWEIELMKKINWFENYALRLSAMRKDVFWKKRGTRVLSEMEGKKDLIQSIIYKFYTKRFISK